MRIDKIEPPCWFTEMKNRKLQLLIYGNDLSETIIETDIPCENSSLISNISDNEEYIIANLELSENISQGKYNITIKNKKGQKTTVDYNIISKRAYKSRQITAEDTIYLIMPDRFAKVEDCKCSNMEVDRTQPDSWHGGNINGIQSHLQYIRDLGFTAIWCTPVLKNEMQASKFENKSYCFYHGYAITDYYSIDSHFGNIKDYCSFVDEAHRIGLKIIKDIVFNHCGKSHQWFKSPPMRNWFNNYESKKRSNYTIESVYDIYASTIDQRDTVTGWFTEDMPDLNLENRQVLLYLTQMTVWWIETADIDAIRMDTYLYSDKLAMYEWLKYIQLEYPKFAVAAETWVGDSAFTAKVQMESLKDGICSLIVMDFALQEKMKSIYEVKDEMERCKILYRHFAYDFMYPNPMQVMAFLDNHDMKRWYYNHRNIKQLKQAIGILLTIPRIPQITYGTELLFSGDGYGESHGNMRNDFPGGWKEDTINKFLPQNRTRIENDFLSFMKSLLNWRNNSSAIKEGQMVHFIPQNGVYVYFRFINNEMIMVAVNFSNQKRNLSIGHYKEKIDGYHTAIDIITKDKYLLDDIINIDKDGILILKLS